MTKEELTAREAGAWAEFETLLAAVPEERLETPALDGGWSVKDVLWHVAFWWDDLVRASGEEWRELEGDTDAINERELGRSRAEPFAEVRAKADESRSQMLGMWASLGEITPEIEEWFVVETVEHYAEHLPQIRTMAEDPTVKARGA